MFGRVAQCVQMKKMGDCKSEENQDGEGYLGVSSNLSIQEPLRNERHSEIDCPLQMQMQFIIICSFVSYLACVSIKVTSESTRRTLSQFWSFKIRRTTFLS